MILKIYENFLDSLKKQKELNQKIDDDYNFFVNYVNKKCGILLKKYGKQDENGDFIIKFKLFEGGIQNDEIVKSDYKVYKYFKKYYEQHIQQLESIKMGLL